MENSNKNKEIALSILLDCSTEYISNVTDLPYFDIGNEEYLVLDGYEREDRIMQEIEEMLFAFRAEFVENMTGIEGIAEILNLCADHNVCEDLNKPLKILIEGTCGMKKFVEEAVNADGYGHFLSSYDGNEEEIEYNGTTYYIYRAN